LLFLDDDMEADQELLAAHDRSHRAGAEIVLGHIPLHPDSPATFLASGVEHWAEERASRLARPGTELTIFDLVCGQASIRSDLFRVLGGFDESFTRHGTYGNEDLEFGARALDSGCKIVFNPDAISYQRYVVGFRAFLDRYRDRAKADVELTRKHPLLADAFGIRRHGWTDRLLFRPLATLPFLGEGLTRTCASLGLAIAERNPRSKIAARLFWPGRQMTYWRAVAKSGGFKLSRGSAEDSRYNP
jgi:GT2 family glycosyltransferase